MHMLSRAVAFAALSLIVATLFVLPALAQAPAASTVDVGGIFGAWRPYLLDIIGVAAAAIAGLICELLRRKLNLSISAEHREALQRALTNAAGLALNSLGNKLDGKTIDVKSPEVAQAVNYVAKAAPDALAHFGLTPQALEEKIVAKIPQVANTASPPA